MLSIKTELKSIKTLVLPIKTVLIGIKTLVLNYIFFEIIFLYFNVLNKNSDNKCKIFERLCNNKILHFVIDIINL